MRRGLLLVLFGASVSARDDTCAVAPATRLDCYPTTKHFPNATEEACRAQGCCWDAAQSIPCAFGRVPEPTPAACSAVVPSSRMACRNPRYFLSPNSATECAHMGCCFDTTSGECFQPRTTGYELDTASWHETATGFSGTLRQPAGARGPFGNDIRTLALEVDTQDDSRVRVRITDPTFPRFEVPLNISATPTAAIGNRAYDVRVTSAPFGIAVVRRATGETLFNSTPTPTGNGLIFENQFLELSTSTPTQATFFGLGEHVGTFLAPADGDHFTIWARDQVANKYHAHTRNGSDNVYGVHPFYVRREATGAAHGVFLLNANAIEVVAQPQSLTFRTVGGILDFFVFAGPTPAAAVAQYTGLVGRPALPPYWALGYHLCRWQNLKNPHPDHRLSDVVSTLQRMRDFGVPHDGQWTDIDAMDRKMDFTWSDDAFPIADVVAFIDDLHAHDQHYIPIVDAGIAVASPAYADGVASQVFMRDPGNGSWEQDKAWPGMVAFTDFYHPNASAFWEAQLRSYYATAQYDGIWLDMNEPSSFCTEGGRGSQSCFPNDTYVAPAFVKSADVMGPFDPYRQPYVPGQKVAATGNLAFKTAALGAHHVNSIHYNLHSLYGHANVMATRQAVDHIRGKRTLILTRSTYAGDGQYAAHWLGDNAATWTDMRQSIAGVLAANVFGMPMVGPDVCGFRANTTRELCIRWHQAAVLFPFMRNHNEAERDQAPVDFDVDAIDMIKQTLLKRYALLPALYTALYHAAVDGATVVRSLYFEFPDDAATVQIESQYLLGSSLLVAPVLTPTATMVDVYFPKALWFDLWSGERVQTTGGRRVTVDAPLETVPMYLRGGAIVPLQAPSTTTTASRKNPFSLKIALSATGDAVGDLYMDSGDSIDPLRTAAFTRLSFGATQEASGVLKITSTITASGYTGPETKVHLETIQVYGAKDAMTWQVDGADATWNATTGVLTLSGLALPIAEPFTLTVRPSHEAPNGSASSVGASWIVWVVVAGIVATALIVVHRCYQRRHGYRRVA
ncbi:hypothetical protein SPRG_04000, partial [Saprolegnia parasitica CBS 223.65]